MKTLCLLFLAAVSVLSYRQPLKEKSNAVTVDFSDPVTEAAQKVLRKNRALIMGVSHYQNASAQLQSLDRPAINAQQVYDQLTKNYTFDPEDVILLKDPTRQQIIDAFDKLAHVTSEKDNLVVFYTGHGFWDKQRELGYWLPADARIDSRSNWISNSDVKDNLAMASIKAKHTLRITDACFGGSIFKSRGMTSERMIQLNELTRKAMTSGNLSQVPDKSIFLQQLIKRLNDNLDDYLPAVTLYTRIYEPITNNSSTNPVYGIIQGAGDEGGDFIFERRKKIACQGTT